MRRKGLDHGRGGGVSKGHAVRGMIGSKCGFAHVAGLRNDT